jgi:hypothetical protein
MIRKPRGGAQGQLCGQIEARRTAEPSVRGDAAMPNINRAMSVR